VFRGGTISPPVQGIAGRGARCVSHEAVLLYTCKRYQHGTRINNDLFCFAHLSKLFPPILGELS
jgi:hypothetical protein